MPASAIMIQGTASSVGKSVLVTALCRYFRDCGLAVAPFKAQNMSLNSYATADGCEIGRAQGLQAEAAGVEAEVDMNPILLKPVSDCLAQLVVLGRPLGNVDARGYHARRGEMLAVIREALERLRRRFEVVVIEGAGSPAEINLRRQDVVNMAVARLADAPVILVGDIDRGGVFASLIGTLELLEPADRDRVAGLVINRFRGDISLLKPGVDWLELKTGLPVLGVVPFLPDLRLDAEDSVCLDEMRTETATIKVAVVKLPRIANFSDFQPLAAERDVSVVYATTPADLADSDLVIIPGTKNTLGDLDWLRGSGLADRIIRMAGVGVPILGICGGYQMLGRRIADPLGVEGSETAAGGLGLLPVTTRLESGKVTERVLAGSLTGSILTPGGEKLAAYEIHAGHTERERGTAAVFQVNRARNGETVLDGAANPAGTVVGTYLHGLFDNAAWRRAFINGLRACRGLEPLDVPAPVSRDSQYDLLAAAVQEYLDMDAIARLVKSADILAARGAI